MTAAAESATDTVTSPFGLFRARVAQVRQLSPAFRRITLTGPDLAGFADNGFDQRIKVILPIAGFGFADLTGGDDWYSRWRALPAAEQNPLRTYTVRSVRAEQHQVDIDFVLHGATGPASRWALQAQPGDEVMLFGPNADWTGPSGGIDFRPGSTVGPLVLAGDETAVPAIARILEDLPADAIGWAFLEVPSTADVLPLRSPAGVAVQWFPRATVAGQHERGDQLALALLTVTPDRTTSTAALPDVDVDADILWEVPDQAGSATEFYFWLAGEAGVVKRLRRQLCGDCGIDRGSVAFMGYWRLGRSEAN